MCSRFLPSIFMWVLGTEFRVLGLGGKWFCLLHHLTGLVPLQLWALVLLGPLLFSDPSLQVQIYLVPGKSTAFPTLPFFLSCQLSLCSRCPHIVISSGSAPFLHGVPDLAACPSDSWRVQLCSSHLVCYTVVGPMTLVACPCVPSVSPAYGPASH